MSFALSGWLIGGILLNLQLRELPASTSIAPYASGVPIFLAVALLVAAGIQHDHLTRKWGESAGADFHLLSPLFAVSTVLMLAIKGRRHPLGDGFTRSIAPAFSGSFITIPASLMFAALLYWYFDRVILAHRERLYTPRRGKLAIIVVCSRVAIGLCGGVLRCHYV